MKIQNPLYDDLPSPDEKKEAKESSNDLEDLLGKFEESLRLEHFGEYNRHINKTINDVLTPEQINSFLQTTITYENDKNYQHYMGLFVSKLIQNSYDNGHNNFVLNTKALKEMHSIGYKLEGTEEKQIQITIEGNTGKWCGLTAKNSTFNIKGNAGDGCGRDSNHTTFNIKGNTGNWCGEESKHTTYNINGNTGDHCGSVSKHTTYNIKGNTGNDCGYKAYHSTYNIKRNTGDGCGAGSEHSTYNIEGNIGDECGYFSKHSTYITHNKKLYKRLLQELPETNKAILKDKNDKIIEEKTV